MLMKVLAVPLAKYELCVSTFFVLRFCMLINREIYAYGKLNDYSEFEECSVI